MGIYTDLPNYQRAWKAQGFDEADYENGPSDRLLDALVALGPMSRVQEKLAERKDHWGALEEVIRKKTDAFAGKAYIAIKDLDAGFEININEGNLPSYDIFKALREFSPSQFSAFWDCGQYQI